MGALYQLTFFLALALLAIVITVFVLAVSLLGRAVNISLEEQQKAEKERQKNNEDQLTEIQGQLEQTRKDSTNIESLTKSLADLKKQAKTHKRKLAWIKWKPKFLKACWGVFIPGALFVFSIILSALALHFQTSFNISLSLWILSLIAMFPGITLICLILKVIEGVAVTADETSFVRQKDMLKAALFEHDESKKPVLYFKFRDEQPPFTIPVASEKTIRFDIALSSGDIGRKPEVLFFAPIGFEFPGKETIIQPPNVKNVGGFLTAGVNYPVDCAGGFHLPGKIVIKAPSKKGTYSLWYHATCEQYLGPTLKFNVEVK